ncbi:hypothetical protein HKI87_12g72150 [Chloropicon roscoffensis]|uniref:Uncharacterized protein n=1 Tax=Chloropicon roscoffensis TaxID=1461544 RepID=A0AAX4PI09_9CHLO
MADPLTKRKTGVFEDFPLPERKHFDAHRAARGSLGAGFAPMDEEKRAFAHLKRDNVRKDSHGSATIGGIGGTDKSAWKSSYQAFADGSDDIGKVRRFSRKKSHQGAQQQRSELSLFQSGRTFLTGRDEIENDRGDNRMPGYTGHVPKANGAGTKGDNRNPADKSLLAENYRHNVVGYTGHIK